MPTKEQVIEVAKQCFDPEIPVNIWDLGLIYDIEAADDKIDIRMTLTTQACPSAQQIPHELKAKLAEKLKTPNINVQVVFEPLWTPDRISEEGKKRLGISEE